MESSLAVPRKLRIGVISSLIIVAFGLAEFATHFLSFDSEFLGVLLLPCGAVVFAAGLCGAFCGFATMFRVQGFYRLVAVLSAMVSLYAVVRCAGFFGWAINLP